MLLSGAYPKSLERSRKDIRFHLTMYAPLSLFARALWQTSAERQRGLCNREAPPDVIIRFFRSRDILLCPLFLTFVASYSDLDGWPDKARSIRSELPKRVPRFYRLFCYAISSCGIESPWNVCRRNVDVCSYSKAAFASILSHVYHRELKCVVYTLLIEFPYSAEVFSLNCDSASASISVFIRRLIRAVEVWSLHIQHIIAYLRGIEHKKQTHGVIFDHRDWP